MNKTSIEWTHRPGTTGMTWNPIRARAPKDSVSWQQRTGTFCTRISPGCKHCYASTINKRFGTGAEYEVPNLKDHEFFIDERILNEPLLRKKPATIFVGDMFDMFHEAIPDLLIMAVAAVMVQTRWHTYQALTKRADRMMQFFQMLKANQAMDVWPLANLWLGVSVESQKYADERIPLLLQTPAAVRFLSVEPLLEEVDLENLPSASGIGRYLNCLSIAGVDPSALIPSKIDWVICGGESGPGARPFNLSWAESLLKQCRAAEVPFFFKQAGSNPFWSKPFDQPDWPISVSSKGGDMSEWPEHLRVREFPVLYQGDKPL